MRPKARELAQHGGTPSRLEESDPAGCDFDRDGRSMHRKKKVREFPVPSRDVTTKLSLGGNNDLITELFLPRGSLVSDIPAGDGKLVNLFFRCVACPDRPHHLPQVWG
jgi:hypothetical protein